MPIRVLDAATVGRIAAGEVVERPSSIAKELIENSLDAGATAITVEIKDGGIDYLRVTDNGCGIAPEDARIAFENHATSKIASGDSLSDIVTLGFRGEALPSIAAVARVTMTTRQKGRDSGLKLQIEGGRIMDVSEAGCPEGTTIVVRDLFFNTPVRRGFLKKPTTEAGVIADMIARLILGNPGTSMRFISNGRTVYHSYGDGDIRHAALAIYGRETAQKMLLVDETEGSLRISGLIGLDELARANRSQEFFFINGRTVRAPLIAQALEVAVRSRVMIGQYPMCALSLRLPPTAVDVNVHPSKLEVRFRDEADIRQKAEMMLTRACCGTKILDPEAIVRETAPLNDRPVIKITAPEQTTVFSGAADDPLSPPIIRVSPSAQREETVPPPAPEIGERAERTPDMAAVQTPSAMPRVLSFREAPPPAAQRLVMPPEIRFVSQESENGPKPAANTLEPPTRSETLPKKAVDNAEIRVIGVFDNTYIIAEMDETLILIDQHAAHERILYERFRKALEGGTIMQPLVAPIIMNVSARDRSILMDNQALLLEAGYEIEPFGERDIQVRTVPYVLGQAELKPLFADLIDRLDQLRSATIDRRRGEVITASCKRAVKAGDHLSDAEIRALISDMLTTSAPPNCPHGRPIIKTFKRGEVDHMFRRN
ncbi:MAG: DNA mismatch repair endonuclease MutL [Clostridiales bacterium]|nr:DNA mismatch repair endonuclease MutL [Clostridiales bacterium]MDD7365997.1 DNA mismatch repair endonuclease MutL [Clostridiales bacterium]MDY2871670.1 DNA mismatch repair endonuclease MutL [Eubacteriales bacterium]